MRSCSARLFHFDQRSYTDSTNGYESGHRAVVVIHNKSLLRPGKAVRAKFRFPTGLRARKRAERAGDMAAGQTQAHNIEISVAVTLLSIANLGYSRTNRKTMRFSFHM
jgi:hypothetical protein